MGNLPIDHGHRHLRKPTLVEISAVIALADQLSYAKAAVRLGISTSTLSGTIRTLEERLGVRLINRSNRSVTLSEAGERLVRSMRPLLNDYDVALDALNRASHNPSGSVRILTWPYYGPTIFSALLPAFMRKFPNISLEFSSIPMPHKVDLVEENFDLGSDFFERIGRDMTTIRLTRKIRTVIVGSPAYFARHPKPRTLNDIAGHNCIRTRLPDGSTLPWRTRHGGKDTIFPVDGTLIFNDQEIGVSAAINGLGLGFGTYPMLEPALSSGHLVEVMRDWSWESEGIFLYYPTQRAVPAHVQAFIDFAKDKLDLDRIPGSDPSVCRQRSKASAS